MCGINGIIYKEAVLDIRCQLQAMNDQIIHRGPNDQGLYIDDNRIGMAMRRLSVIDLSTGHQPMSNADNTVTIVFNGEIYNYHSLKNDLQNEGVQFTSTSDTEVLLKLYEKYGTACVSMLNGMFAFSIYDSVKKQIFIARDRFGEKPLYYHHAGNRFVWASELKSIVSIFPALKKIDTESMALFFALTYIPAPHSIYQDVYKLKAGHYLLISTSTLEITIEQYWNLPLKSQENSDITYEQAKSQLRELLFDSVEKRMVADVPVGVFLSGGVDSTIIAAIMSKISSRKIQAFTVGSAEKAYDESGRAALVAAHLGAEQNIFMLSANDMLGSIDKVILNYDEPFADSSALPTYFIAGRAVENVTVALTGDGGDEVFGGYNKYGSLRYQKIIKTWIPPFLQKKIFDPILLQRLLGGKNSKSNFTKAKRLLSSLAADNQTSHLNILALGFKQEDIEKLITPQAGNSNYKQILGIDLQESDYSELKELKLLRYLDKDISLEGDMLVKVDRASMLCSLECRAPMLDHRLMEETYSWPDEFLLQGNNKKRILKDSFEDLLPNGFFNAPKSGFEIPIGNWLRKELKDDVLHVLSAGNLHESLNELYIKNIITEHLSAKADHSWKLWTLYCFQKWYLANFRPAIS